MSLTFVAHDPQRWGDAPVHSIAAALFVPRDKIHFFSEMGYEHNPYTHCPKSNEAWARGKCTCDQRKSFGAFSILVLSAQEKSYDVVSDIQIMMGTRACQNGRTLSDIECVLMFEMNLPVATHLWRCNRAVYLFPIDTTCFPYPIFDLLHCVTSATSWLGRANSQEMINEENTRRVSMHCSKS